MVKNGKIEWRTYTKTPPVYVSSKSCHDPKVFPGIFKGVGLRLRETNSTVEDFDKTVEEYSKAFACAGYPYQHAKAQLTKFRDLDPVVLVKKQRSGQEERRRRRKGCVTFWNAPWDPRVPPPRTLLSKHYHILQGDAVTTGLFPRKNLMSSGRRLQNLGELLSPTDQGGGRRGQGGGAAGGGGGGAGGAGGAGGRGGQRRRARPHPGVQGPQAGPRPGPGESGTLHCDQFGTSRGYDTFSHMVESSTIYSHQLEEKYISELMEEIYISRLQRSNR